MGHVAMEREIWRPRAMARATDSSHAPPHGATSGPSTPIENLTKGTHGKRPNGFYEQVVGSSQPILDVVNIEPLALETLDAGFVQPTGLQDPEEYFDVTPIKHMDWLGTLDILSDQCASS